MTTYCLMSIRQFNKCPYGVRQWIGFIYPYLITWFSWLHYNKVQEFTIHPKLIPFVENWLRERSETSFGSKSLSWWEIICIIDVSPTTTKCLCTSFYSTLASIDFEFGKWLSNAIGRLYTILQRADNLRPSYSDVWKFL